MYTIKGQSRVSGGGTRQSRHLESLTVAWLPISSANKKVKAEADKRRAITTELTQAKHNMQYIKAQYAVRKRRGSTLDVWSIDFMS